MERSDVVVVGGGVVGLAAAAALDALGARVTVLEAHEGANPAFRGELVHPRGAHALAKLGLHEPLLDAGAARVRGFAVFDAPAPHRVEPVLLPYSSRYGDGLALDHVELVDALRHEVARRARTRVVRGARVREVVVVQGRVVGVRTEGGAEHRAALVVAADGRHSRLRKILGVETQTELVSHSVAIALERDVLQVPGHGHVFVDSPGPTLAYPCGGGRVRMVIDVPLAAAKGQERLRAYLRDHCVARLPEPLATSMAEAMVRSPLGGAANHAMYTSACAVRGAALIGDAGGCSHPITAAGMTNGMHDVATLAECVERRGLTDGALALYQRRRYRFIRGREAFTRALYDVLLGATPGTRGLRDGMFAYWRSAERARRTSIAVLCGDDERVGAFVAEYLRVVARSSWLCAGGAFAARRPGAAWSGLGALYAAAGEAMGVAVRSAGSALALERTVAVADAPSGPDDKSSSGLSSAVSGGSSTPPKAPHVDSSSRAHRSEA
jgi:2-polyprenyl-6-methoxyphenol hydroxylase-like FAD-dependent oxidoreductase